MVTVFKVVGSLVEYNMGENVASDRFGCVIGKCMKQNARLGSH
jgi:hypothetical protein